MKHQISINTYVENAVADSEYVENSATYPQSDIDFATAYVVERLQAAYPEAEIVTESSQGGKVVSRDLDSENYDDSVEQEYIEYLVSNFWQDGLDAAYKQSAKA